MWAMYTALHMQTIAEVEHCCILDSWYWRIFQWLIQFFCPLTSHICVICMMLCMLIYTVCICIKLMHDSMLMGEDSKYFVNQSHGNTIALVRLVSQLNLKWTRNTLGVMTVSLCGLHSVESFCQISASVDGLDGWSFALHNVPATCDVKLWVLTNWTGLKWVQWFCHREDADRSSAG